MKSAFDILQEHHDYLQKNGEKPSEYEEDRILAAMEEYANLKIDFINSYLPFKEECEHKTVYKGICSKCGKTVSLIHKSNLK